MKKVISKVINFIFSFFRVKKNKICFQTGNKKVDGNPYALYHYIKENCGDEFDLKWIATKDTDVSNLDKKDVAYYRTFLGYYHLATSKYWFCSHSVGSLLSKKTSQIYLQAWHGIPIKKMGYDINPVPEDQIMDHVKEWDYYLASDEENASIMISSTHYNKKIDITGMARTDEIVNMSKEMIEEKKKEILKGIDYEGKRIILYAPTFRDKDLFLDHVDIPVMSLNQLEDCIVLIRLHPLVSDLFDDSVLGNNMYNFSKYSNGMDLLMISDCLISDYSSMAFDFALLKRPMFFYAYDYDEYVQERGDFYLDYFKDLPGTVVQNEKDLFDCLANLDDNEDLRLNKFNERYNSHHDGHVCERIVEKIKKGYYCN